jgi:CO/xanthine dehydrogenase FAD-binding subunit
MEFLSPQYLTEAYEILDKHPGHYKICAGMTHLLRFYPQFPKEVESHYKGFLHVGELAALSECREENGKFTLGSTATIADLASDPLIARYATAVREAADQTSTVQIRNRRTLGGEVAWGSYHSPLITALMALEARITFRRPARANETGHEETITLSEFYSGVRQRQVAKGKILETRAVRTESTQLILRLLLPPYQSGSFSFFRKLTPKIQTENSGVVLAVSGKAQNGTIHRCRVVASGLWMKPIEEELPLEGVRMNDASIFERLYTFCEKYPFEQVRRAGPPGGPLGLIVFGLMKEGFSSLLGRS